MIVAVGGMGERRGGPSMAVVDWGEGGRAVCGERKHAGWGEYRN